MKVSIGNPITLSIGEGSQFHHRRRFEPTGRHPMATIPQPSQCCIARLLHGAWLLSTIEGQPASCDIEFRAPESHNFIAVELAPGEKIVFDFHYFVGFTAGLRLHTQLTLNVASLALPRILFQTAEGPGMLLLQARGVPRIWQESGPIPPISPARLICWSLAGRFDLQGSDRAADIFLSPIYLKTDRIGLLVIDADEPNETGGSQIWRMLKSFWKPI